MIIVKQCINRDLGSLSSAVDKLNYLNTLMATLDKKRSVIVSSMQGQYVEIVEKDPENNEVDAKKEET